ncbi:hypothetical protein KCU71_g18, partial [Aureobasidium melanogenum]
MNLESVSSTAALALKTPMIASSILTDFAANKATEISPRFECCRELNEKVLRHSDCPSIDRSSAARVETQEDGDDIHGGRLCIRAALFWSRPKSHGCEDLAQAQRKRCDQPTLGLRHGIYSSVLGKPEAGDAWCSSWQWLAVGRRIIWLGLYVSP